jgi:hypothetical protein
MCSSPQIWVLRGFAVDEETGFGFAPKGLRGDGAEMDGSFDAPAYVSREHRVENI